MDNIRPQDLPAFLDPLLDYLADHLPPSLYNALFTALSYGLMLFSGLLSLVAALPSWKPWDWDAQKVIPPLIVFLTAYYTLLNIYRTTSFMVRTTFWLMKWGAIFGLVGAGVGWLSGSTGGGAGASRRDASSRRQGQAGGRAGSAARPRPWDSFSDHRQWQYNEREAGRAQEDDSASDAQHIIQQIADYAGRAMGGSAYDLISGAKSFLDRIADASSTGEQDDSAANQGRSSTRRRKTKASTQQRSSR